MTQWTIRAIKRRALPISRRLANYSLAREAGESWGEGSRRMLASFLLLALLAAAGNPAPSTAQPAPRISVVFVEPEKFTEMRYSEAERYSPAILLQLQRFIVETGADSLPEPLRLEVRITDIDMAGDFELFRGPVRDQVRVIKSSYPPRIALEFRVIETPERVVKEGSAS